MRARSLLFYNGILFCTFLGVLGIRVKIMLPWDPAGKTGPKRPLPDHVAIVEPKPEPVLTEPYSEAKAQPIQKPELSVAAAAPAAAAAAAATATSPVAAQ